MEWKWIWWLLITRVEQKSWLVNSGWNSWNCVFSRWRMHPVIAWFCSVVISICVRKRREQDWLSGEEANECVCSWRKQAMFQWVLLICGSKLDDGKKPPTRGIWIETRICTIRRTRIDRVLVSIVSTSEHHKDKKCKWRRCISSLKVWRSCHRFVGSAPIIGRFKHISICSACVLSFLWDTFRE